MPSVSQGAKITCLPGPCRPLAFRPRVLSEEVGARWGLPHQFASWQLMERAGNCFRCRAVVLSVMLLVWDFELIQPS